MRRLSIEFGRGRWRPVAFAVLTIVLAIFPVAADAQKKPAGPKPAPSPQALAAAEKERACRVADEAWDLILQVSQPYLREGFLLPFATWEVGADQTRIPPPWAWFPFPTEIFAKPTGRPPTPSLQTKWRKAPASSVFSCPGLASKYAIEPQTPKHDTPAAFGMGYDNDYLGIQLPVVSGDGANALIYYLDSIGTSEGGKLIHIARIDGRWRVVGRAVVHDVTV